MCETLMYLACLLVGLYWGMAATRQSPRRREPGPPPYQPPADQPPLNRPPTVPTYRD